MQKKKKKLMIRFFSHKFFFDIQILMGAGSKIISGKNFILIKSNFYRHSKNGGESMGHGQLKITKYITINEQKDNFKQIILKYRFFC